MELDERRRAAREAAAAIDLSRFPWKIGLGISVDVGGTFRFCVGATQNHRDTGEPIRLSNVSHIAACEANSSTYDGLVDVLIRHAIEALRSFVAHEFRECLLVRGVRIEDPHA